MFPRALFIFLALSWLPAAGACTVSLNAEANLYVRPRSFVRVTSACPAPKSEADDRVERPARPDADAIWISGHWTWESGWVWASGRWVVPRPGYTWEPPVCTARGGSFRYYPGYFRSRTEEPPPVYREPGHIRVHAPSDGDRDLPARVVVRPGEAPPTETGPDAELRGNPATANANVRPDAEAQGNQATANTDVSDGPLECNIRIRRLPRGGNVQIDGRGFSERVTVMISGNTASIRRRTATSISAVANHAGEVKVIRGDVQASCGRISLIR